MQTPLVRALPWIARMVARQCGVEVRFDRRATTASINAQKQITLPEVPAGDAQSSALALGYIVHEAFHGKYSDFVVLHLTKSMTEESFLGVFEDERIERLGMTGFPGAKLYLLEAWKIMYERGSVRRPTGDPVAPALDVFTYALAHCRASCLGLEVAKHDLPIAKRVVEERFGVPMTERLTNIFNAVPACISTAAALELARQTMQCLFEATGEAQEAEKPPAGHQPPELPSQTPQTPQQGAQGTPPTDDADATGASVGGEGAGTSEGTEPASGQTAAEGTSVPGDTDASARECGAVPQWTESQEFIDQVTADLAGVEGDAGEHLKQQLREAIKETQASGSYGSSLMLGAAQLVEPQTDQYSAGQGAELLASSAAATSALQSEIRHLLVSLTDEETRFAPRGRIKPTRLWKLRTGIQNVFEQTEEGLELDTAVTVLLDVSKSMDGQKLRLAARSTMAIAMAIDGLASIRTSVCAFPGRTDQHVDRLKRFGESAQRASGRFAAVRATGSTPLAQALYAVGPDLLEQAAGGHLLIVVTDGKADCVARARLALNELEAEGIDVVGIGIGCDVSDLFDRSASIGDIRDLSSKLFEVLNERFKAYAALAA